jgi:glyoxylase-like metal-dependent hydrolase (beta-lactamase superfamily II)
MQIIPLSEGSFTIDKSKVFVPFDEETDSLQQRNKGSLLVEVQPFIVITKKDVLLLDTGLGFKTKHGVQQIHQNLLDNGIQPDSITKVLMSHLHKDHSGGVSYTDADNKVKLSFPKSKYYIQQDELHYALSDKTASYIKGELECLAGASQVDLLRGNGSIDGYIDYEVTGAHSKFHQVFWIREEGEVIFFGADDAPQLQQMKSRYVAKYDYDGKKCMELRQDWWKRGTEEHWTFLFYHDIKRAVVKQ